MITLEHRLPFLSSGEMAAQQLYGLVSALFVLTAMKHCLLPGCYVLK